jgi:PPOX class probable F420-dependent enzyme
MSVPVPNTHIDLLQKSVHGVLTTIMSNGMPQSSIVWVDYDGEYVLINTTLERQKGKNMQSNPKVAILVIDPKNTGRWIEVRGHVKQITQQDAEAHADKLTQRYCQPKQHFYGDIYPIEQKDKETRVVIKIEPVKISLDAIFK